MRWSWRRRVLVSTALGAVAGVSIVVATADLWLPSALQHFVLARSQRRVELEGLDIGLTRDLQPTVALRGLRIENAPWADARPFVVAREVRFTFAWRSLTEGRIVVSRLALRDAQVDLERQADGLRNWRLSAPQDRGPGKIRVVSLDAQGSRVRFVHRGEHLDVDTAIAPLDKPRGDGVARGLALTKRLTLSGHRDGQAFEGNFDVSDVLTFLESKTSFAVRGEAKTAATTLHIDGTIADLAKLAEVDARVQLSGPSLNELQAPLRHTLPATPRYRVSAHVRKTGTRTALTGIEGLVGSTDFTGHVLRTLVPERDQGRTQVEAHLHSGSANWGDLVAIRSGAQGNAPAALREADVQASVAIDAISTPWPLHLRDVKVAASLSRGVLVLSPIQLRGAGGTVDARATLDAGHRPATLELTADIDGVRIDRLLPEQAENTRVEGALSGRVALQTTGATAREWVANAVGQVNVRTHEATIASRLDARLALNGGRLFRTLLEGSEPVPVRCAAADWQMRSGKLHARRLVMETDRVKLVGAGNVDLANRTLALSFTPHRKQAALFALQRSISVSGPFDHTRVELAQARPAAAQESCLAAH